MMVECSRLWKGSQTNMLLIVERKEGDATVCDSALTSPLEPNPLHVCLRVHVCELHLRLFKLVPTGQIKGCIWTVC